MAGRTFRCQGPRQSTPGTAPGAATVRKPETGPATGHHPALTPGDSHEDYSFHSCLRFGSKRWR
jgi:hypothetical protein